MTSNTLSALQAEPAGQHQHTPGPWKLETVRTLCGICHKIGTFPYKDGKTNSACVYVDYPGTGPIEAELLANARLMQAAPDLLAALATIVKYLSDTDDEGLIEHAEPMMAAREALAKARVRGEHETQPEE